MNIFNVLVTNFKNITFKIDDFSKFKISQLKIKNGKNYIAINKISFIKNIVKIKLKKEINIKNLCFIIYDNLYIKANYFKLFSTKEFDNRYFHDCKLGTIYKKNYTIFRIWSPVANYINVILYKNGEPTYKEKIKKFKMKESNGLWAVVIKKNLKGYFYNYEINIYNTINEVIDPYTKSTGINGIRGAILDLNDTNPPNWNKDSSPKIKNHTDAIIYELNIRDISINKNSGTKYKGKFLALTENNTKSNKNLSTVLQHIKELGITHIQLMPIFDYSFISVDEKNPINYNWGYDPQNYNVPEGNYSTNPYDPICRIYELKKTIQHLHKNNICINIDVVYNHIASNLTNNFEKIFPGYYFRFYENGHFSNGSGCTNDTASEHSMMRKYIIDSITYWIKEYHIDGFRFDLMGIHDIKTMNLIRKKIDKISSSIMLYGEGWNLNTTLPNNLKACKKNSYLTPNIGYFNDVIRDSIKGNIFSIKDKGFVTGKNDMEEIIKNCIIGSLNLFNTPNQSINYASCHDNNTLWDKIELSCPNESLDTKKNMLKLCNAIILTSQGIPFLHSGVEFCRTKYRNSNSYNSPDNINSIDWDRKLEFLDVFNYHKHLIHLRKSHPAFRMHSKKDIKNNLNFINKTPKNTIAFILKNHANNDKWKNILVIYNANKFNVSINIPYNTWYLISNSKIIKNSPIKTIIDNKIEVEKISTYILYTL